MFEILLRGTGTSPLLSHAFADTDAMLATAEHMYDALTEAFLEGRKPDIDLEHLDEDVNLTERTVRRGVFQHLTIDPRKDLTASLVLLSVVHDAERIGDYIKATLRIMQLLGFPAVRDDYREDFVRLIEAVHPMFAQTRSSFTVGEQETASGIITQHVTNREMAWKLLERLADDESMDHRQTILVTTSGRNFKRVSAHLANIASSVTQPFDKIGTKDEED